MVVFYCVLGLFCLLSPVLLVCLIVLFVAMLITLGSYFWICLLLV